MAPTGGTWGKVLTEADKNELDRQLCGKSALITANTLVELAVKMHYAIEKGYEPEESGFRHLPDEIYHQLVFNHTALQKDRILPANATESLSTKEDKNVLNLSFDEIRKKLGGTSG